MTAHAGFGENHLWVGYQILTASETNDSLAVAVLDVFNLKAARHPVFGMPVLARLSGWASYIIVLIKVGPFTEGHGHIENLILVRMSNSCSMHSMIVQLLSVLIVTMPHIGKNDLNLRQRNQQSHTSQWMHI
jgi:hypothetical protein